MDTPETGSISLTLKMSVVFATIALMVSWLIYLAQPPKAARNIDEQIELNEARKELDRQLQEMDR